MSLTELLPSLQSLPRPDKLRAIQYLAAELAREDDVSSLLAGQTCEVWSPYDAHEAAAVLLRVLEAEDAGVTDLSSP